MTRAPSSTTVRDYDHDDDLIAEARREGHAQLRIYCPERTAVVLGRGSVLEHEVDVDACLRDGVPILRRRGGGCSVLLDAGNVIVSYATAGVAGIGHNCQYLVELSRWLIDGLSRLGVEDLEVAGVCDLVQRGRKVSGGCLYRSRDLLFYSATLLVAPKLDGMVRYLRHPPREPAYRGGRGHDDFVAALRLPLSLRYPQVLAAALRSVLAPITLRALP